MNYYSTDANPPFFVIGSPRSGTTLLRLMLTNHPSLVIPPECGFLLWLYSDFSTWTSADFEDPCKRAQFAKSVYEARKFETWGISIGEIESVLAKFKPSKYGHACACIYWLFCKKANKEHAVWGDKNNYYLSHIDELQEIYPRARFVHIVRDGRDIACSYREVMAARSQSEYRPELPTDIRTIANTWASDVIRIREQLSLINSELALEVRYEDLTTYPQSKLTSLCRFLGVEFSSSMLTFHNMNDVFRSEPSATIDWKRRTNEPVSPATVGRYRDFLTVEEIKCFDSIAGQELARYDYQVS